VQQLHQRELDADVVALHILGSGTRRQHFEESAVKEVAFAMVLDERLVERRTGHVDVRIDQARRHDLVRRIDQVVDGAFKLFADVDDGIPFVNDHAVPEVTVALPIEGNNMRRFDQRAFGWHGSPISLTAL
jgi:hypothetical protein